MEVDGVDTCEPDDETMKMEVDAVDESGVGAGDETYTLRSAKRAKLAGEITKFLLVQSRVTAEYIEYKKIFNAMDTEERRKQRLNVPVPWRVYAWCLLTWSDEAKDFQISKYDAISQDSYPDDIGYFSLATTLLYNSRLYFIGGRHWKQRGGLEKSVHSVELDMGKPEPKARTGSWSKHPDIHSPRGLHSVMGVGDSIYVFGGASCFIDRHTWGQRFDLKSEEWKCLDPHPDLMLQPSVRHPTSYTVLHSASSYAVYYNCRAFSYSPAERDVHPDLCQVPANQNLILFPTMVFNPVSSVKEPVICIFHCNSNKWLPSIKLNISDGCTYQHFPPFMRDRHVVVDGVFIWHRNGSINGYDLINQKQLAPLFIIPTDQWRCYYYVHCVRLDPSVVFSHHGDSLFLFIYDKADRHAIHCCKFRIQKRNQGQDFRLLEEKYRCFSTESMEQDDLIDVHPLVKRLVRSYH